MTDLTEYGNKIAALDYKEADKEFNKVLNQAYSIGGTSEPAVSKLKIVLKHIKLLELLGESD